MKEMYTTLLIICIAILLSTNYLADFMHYDTLACLLSFVILLTCLITNQLSHIEESSKRL